MKSGVLITLIIFGTLLLAGPSIMDHFRDADDFGLTSAGRMSMLLAGGLMILGVIVGGVLGARHLPGPKV